MSNPRQLAVACAKACAGKKAAQVVVLDVRKLTFITDYFVIASTSGDRQAKAITDDLRARMREEDRRERGVEGLDDSRWVLQDFGDVVVHLFHESQREFYDLEGLWADAPRVRWTRSKAKA